MKFFKLVLALLPFASASPALLKRGRFWLCQGVFVQDNWLLTLKTCSAETVLDEKGRKSRILEKVDSNSSDFALVKTQFSPAPPVSLVADAEFPYEAVGQHMRITYKPRKRKQATRLFQVRHCGDLLCTGGRKIKKVRCAYRRGSPLNLDHHTDIVVGLVSNNGGCIRDRRFNVEFNKVRLEKPWMSAITGKELEKAPVLCD